MGRFNTSTTRSSRTTNYEGETAYKMSPELELYSAVCTASLQPKFYTPKAGDQLNQIRALVKKVDPEFVAKLAVYARESMYLRSVPLVLAIELQRAYKKRGALVTKTLGRVIQRADEITEALGYYLQANGLKRGELTPLPAAIKKGLEIAFNKFDEYQFAKYDRDRDVSLQDALFLAHARAGTTEQSKLFDKIAAMELKAPFTWEVELSKSKDKKATWEKLIESKKLPYMATLRNLRNMLKAEISKDHLELALDYLSNPVSVERSRQFPFRFLAAYQNITDEGEGSWYTEMVYAALEQATVAAAQNIAGFDTNEKVFIACDMSASMNHAISSKSTMQLYEVGIILAMLLKQKCALTRTGIFGMTFEEIQLPAGNILANAWSAAKMIGRVGHATNGHLVIEYLLENKIEVGKLMFFTDEQWWESHGYESDGGDWGCVKTTANRASEAWAEYKTMYPLAKAYFFDLDGYGNTPLSLTGMDVYQIAGWSEKIFGILDAYERGGSAVKEIEGVLI